MKIVYVHRIRYLEDVREVVDEPVGFGGAEFVQRAVAIGDGAGAAPRAFTHQDVIGGIPDDEGARGIHSEMRQRL